ncbi:hypothetical protein NEDG_01424 [Nematocida displodere]|uniref:B box-type domain-containing protein n=1 Tax=Nematocida displodere TaxID=1805483 RepID=A0A177ECU8_9MICR|nr:hypothetical protein NEDG_01424 [Nematocida displodere]
MNDIEYQLKFLLNSMSLSVDKTKVSDNVKMESLLFLKKYKNQKMIYGFVHPKRAAPMATPVFGVPIDDTMVHHKVLYCQIAIGTPLFTSEEYAMNCKTPRGYDSFIIGNSNTPIEGVIAEVKKSQTFAGYSYIVPDSSRVLVLAEVEFTYDKELEERCKNSDTCEFCNAKPAVSFCLAERASFCGDCDNLFHANQFTQRHDRYYFNEVGKKKFLHCKDHTSTVIDYYCTSCNIPICTQCRIFGTHSESPNSKHKLITYIDACDMLRNKLLNEHELEDVNANRASGALLGVDQEISLFEKNIYDVRTRLECEYKNCLAILNDLVKRRYQKINAKFFEGKHLEQMALRAVEYPLAVDTSVLVDKWKSIEEMAARISETMLPVMEEDREIVVKGNITIQLADTADSPISPSSLDTSLEDNASRKRTEMLLNVARFRS